MKTTDEAGNTQKRKYGYNSLNREQELFHLTAPELQRHETAWELAVDGFYHIFILALCQ